MSLRTIMVKLCTIGGRAEEFILSEGSKVEDLLEAAERPLEENEKIVLRGNGTVALDEGLVDGGTYIITSEQKLA